MCGVSLPRKSAYCILTQEKIHGVSLLKGETALHLTTSVV